MDNHYYFKHTKHSHLSNLSILSDADALMDLAKEKRFQKRKRGKITPKVFFTAMMVAVQTGSDSFRQMAVICGLQIKDTLAKQSLWERTTPDAFRFISAILCRLMTASYQPRKFITRSIKRVLVADSTIVKLHPSLEKSFPGSKNQYLKTSQASARLQVLIDIFSGDFLHFNLSSFRRNDQGAAMDVISLLKKGDLLLRDLGYFTHSSLHAIHLKAAFFITRYRYRTVLHDAQNEKIDVLKKLRKAQKAGLGKIRFHATLGKKEKTPVLVEAILLPVEIAAERRRKAKNDRHISSNHSNEYYELLDWNIVLTNIPEEELTDLDVYTLYKLRWRIENIFKVWKSNLGPKILASHRTNPSHIKCLLVAHMIVLVKLSHLKVFQIPGKPATGEKEMSGEMLPSGMSMFKLLDILIICHRLDPSLSNAEINEQLKRHAPYEKRQTREPLPVQAIRLLA